jgi:PAS domain S-box-containing protein
MHPQSRRASWALDRRSTAGIAVVLVLLLVAGVTSYLALGRAGATASRVAHTYEVLQGIEQLRTALLDAEGQQRGFLLTGDAGYGRAVQAALPELRELVRSLRTLTRDDGGQQRRLDALEPLLAKRLALLRETTELRNGRIKWAIEQLHSDESKNLAEDIRSLLEAMRSDEIGLLHEWSRRSEAAAWGLGLTATLASLLAVLVTAGAVLLINRSIARRKEAEQALALALDHSREALREESAARHTADERLRAVFLASPIGVVALDPQGRVQLWNPAAERTFGWAAAEVIGRPYPLTPAGKQAEFQTLLARVLGGESLLDLELQRQAKDGSAIDVSISAAPLRAPAGGQVTGVLVVLSDVRARRALEAQVGRTQKLEAVGRLAAGIAHDFNNLVTVINGCCELLVRRLPETDPARELLDEVQRSGEQAARLTRQLLAFGSRQIVQPRVLDLNAVVGDLGKLLGRLIGEDVTLVTRLEPAPAPVRADRGQLEQVVMNLALNARDAMPQGGTLTIETRNLGPGVQLTVSDTGVGMDGTVKARIFEPFFTTKDAGKGTGLGLATVYGIVKQSAGTIEVDSEPGRGTTFRIVLPRTDETLADLVVKAPTVILRGWETVLVAEDDRGVRRLVCDGLRSWGYRVLEAGDGAEALRLAAEHTGTIDLLITDVVMPSMSGRVLAERLVELRPGLRVLYLSGHSDDAVVRHGVPEESAALLTKPFAPDALAAKVRAMLGKSKAPCVQP